MDRQRGDDDIKVALATGRCTEREREGGRERREREKGERGTESVEIGRERQSRSGQ